jgi:hypothetical protein
MGENRDEGIVKVRISFAELDERFTEYIRREDMTLWDQGDELVRYNPSDAEYEKLAEHHNRSVSTLRQRMRIANEFPSATRHYGAFYVYAKLINVPDPVKRAEILAEKEPGSWSVDAMARRVSQYLRDTGHTRRVAETHTAGMRLADFRVRGESDGPHDILLTISSDGGWDDVKIAHSVVGGKLRVQVTR